MGNAGRNGGEYYTPRPLIRAIVAVTAPRLGETICDPAVGRRRSCFNRPHLISLKNNSRESIEPFPKTLIFNEFLL